MKNQQGGFTLIEIMIVVVVVSLLASVAYPSYRESVLKGKRTEGRAALMQLMQQEERYFSQNTSYIVFTSASTDENEKKFRWFSGSSAPDSAYEIRADACKGETIQNCVILTAKPGTNKVNPNFKDPVCGNLTLNSMGVTGADHPDCWK
jgi:type IV pilus assembly protein PilE